MVTQQMRDAFNAAYAAHLDAAQTDDQCTDAGIRAVLNLMAGPERIECDCGDLFPVGGYEHGFIAAYGACANCAAADEAKVIKFPAEEADGAEQPEALYVYHYHTVRQTVPGQIVNSDGTLRSMKPITDMKEVRRAISEIEPKTAPNDMAVCSLTCIKWPSMGGGV